MDMCIVQSHEHQYEHVQSHEHQQHEHVQVHEHQHHEHVQLHEHVIEYSVMGIVYLGL